MMAASKTDLCALASSLHQSGMAYGEVLVELQKASSQSSQIGAYDLLQIADEEFKSRISTPAAAGDPQESRARGCRHAVYEKARELSEKGRTLSSISKEVWETYNVVIDPDWKDGAPIEGWAPVLTEEDVAQICEDVYNSRSIYDFPTDFHLTDAGNADRFLQIHGENVRYCTPWKTWYVWDGKRWRDDQHQMVMILAASVARRIHREAESATTPKWKEQVTKWAYKSEELGRKKALVASASPYVPISPNDLDADPNCFSCQNGTLELDTLHFRPFRRSDYISKLADVNYNPGAECPRWLSHLHTIFDQDEGYIRDFQMICGYSLLGSNPEQVMFILWGKGKNGKSVTLDVLQAILSDYSATIPAETLMENRHRSGGDATPELMLMVGSRLVTSGEGEEGCYLSESMVKRWTGDGRVTVRGLYKDAIEITPSQKIFLATNYRPRIRGQDDGIWRRLWLLPFTHYIAESDRDPQITEKLLAERDGIFMWMLEGLRRYNANGHRLTKPEQVQNAVESYRSENDAIGVFLEECCVLEPASRESKTALKTAYLTYCRDNGEDPLSARKFNRLLREKGIDEGKSERFTELRDGSLREIVGRRWIGIRLKTFEELRGEDI